jgi:flagellar biogenesis protein FliO
MERCFRVAMELVAVDNLGGMMVALVFCFLVCWLVGRVIS